MNQPFKVPKEIWMKDGVVSFSEDTPYDLTLSPANCVQLKIEGIPAPNFPRLSHIVIGSYFNVCGIRHKVISYTAEQIDGSYVITVLLQEATNE